MSSSLSKRILAVAPSTRGFGFVVIEGNETFVDWGVKSVRGDKNKQSLAKIEELIRYFQPGVLVLPDVAAKGSRRAPRIRALIKLITALVGKRAIRVKLISRQKVMRHFFVDGDETKFAVAQIIAARFPEEFAFRLPPKRRPWMSEDYRMGIFDAVALALVFCQPNGVENENGL